MISVEGKPPLRADPPEGTSGAEAPSGEKACYSVRNTAGDGGFSFPFLMERRGVRIIGIPSYRGPHPIVRSGHAGNRRMGEARPNAGRTAERRPPREAAPSGGGLGRGNGRRGDPPFSVSCLTEFFFRAIISLSGSSREGHRRMGRGLSR